MAGNKTLKKFKDSKIPKKGTGKTVVEIPIYKEPNTKSEIIGKIAKDQEITWISKSICDEREQIRCNGNNNFGYIIGYDQDVKCNKDIDSITENKDSKKKDNNLKIIPDEIVPISKEEIDFGNEALKEILFENDIKDDKKNENNENQNLSTEGDEINKRDDKNKNQEIEKENNKDKEEGNDIFDNFYFEDDVSKIDLVVKENNRLLDEIFNQMEEENKSEKNFNYDEYNDNSVSKALSSILDVIPGKEKLSGNENLLDALNLIPGGKNSKIYESKKYRRLSLKLEENMIKRSKTISLKGEKIPKNLPSNNNEAELDSIHSEDEQNEEDKDNNIIEVANDVLDEVADGLGEVKGSVRLTNGKYNGDKFSPKYYESGWKGGSKAGIKTHNVAPIGKVGKTISKVTGPLGLIMSCKNIYDAYKEDGDKFGDKTKIAICEETASYAAAIKGVSIGSRIGLIIGGPLGGIIGGVIGGLIGSFGGGKIGEEGGKLLTDKKEDKKEDEKEDEKEEEKEDEKKDKKEDKKEE